MPAGKPRGLFSCARLIGSAGETNLPAKKQTPDRKAKTSASGRGRTGRPSDYTLDKAIEICARMSDGQSIAEIGRAKDMPDARTIFRWLGVHDDFRQLYAQACEARAYFLAEDLLDVADDGRNDWMERLDKDGESIGWVVNGEAVQRSKLRVETRKWLLSKLQPRKYGDKIAVTGAEGGPIRHAIEDVRADLSAAFGDALKE